MDEMSTRNVTKNIKDVFTKVNSELDTIRVSSDVLGKRASDILASSITNNYHEFISSLDNDPQDRSDTTINSIRQADGSYVVSVQGSQVIYDEFGTGERGLDNPHPEKSKYGLNPYLSGSTFQVDENGNFYWWYRTKTYGVPAGMFIYNSVMDLNDNRKLTLELEKLLLQNIKTKSKK